MNNKLVTLVGGGGFLGRYTAQALLAAGARVRIAERDPRHALYLRTQGGLGQTQFVAADVTRADTIARAVEGADAVVNLVGSFAGDLRRLHVDGARAIAEAAASTGATMLHVSAIGADPEAASVYGATKGQGEQAVRAADPHAIIFRPSTVFGREDQFVNRFAQMIARLPIVPVLRAGAKFQPLYVADLADAVVAALSDAERFGGRTFELGGPEVLTMLELQRWIAKTIGRDPEFAPLPDVVGGAIAALSFLPGAPISADQWKMLGKDAIAAPGSDGLAELGVEATPLEAVAPAWLVRYRRAGRFGRLADIQS